MKTRFLFAYPAVALLCLTVNVFAAAPLPENWRPVDPSHLAMKASSVEKDADAEAIFWEVKVDDGDVGELVFTNYIRVKVFTDRGKESQSRIDLHYYGRSRIKDIAARTIKPDGSIVELKSADVYERTIVKVSGLKVKAKSFALPGVEPGSIVEYRWKEIRPNSSADYVGLHFQRDIPIQTITYLVKPYSGPYAKAMGYRQFQMPFEAKFEKAKDGFYRVSMNNVPAHRDEPRMPPEDSVRSWILLYYTDNTSRTTPEKYWRDLGKRLYDVVKDDIKVTDEVRRATTEVIGNATTPEEKLQRLYEFCQTKIKNSNSVTSGLTSEEREKFKANKSPSDTLKKGIGTGGNIDYLFASMVNAAGMEAYLAVSGNREQMFLDRDFMDPYFLLNQGSSFVAVRLGETWRFFSPAERYTPFGMLGWREEGQPALIASKDPVWADTPISAPERSVLKRTGKFKLLDDGTLEGEVKLEYTGQLAIDKKHENEDESEAEREKALIEAIKSRMSTAEVTNVKVENVLDPTKPFIYSYHVRVPGYAQRTGRRLFLQPNYFTRGFGPVFTSSNRKTNIYFRYPWTEEDQIMIDLPQGYALDGADVPSPVEPSQTQQISAHKIKMGVTADGRTLSYERKFFFGGQSQILFPVASYGGLKQLFDIVSKADDHSVSLKQSTATSANQ